MEIKRYSVIVKINDEDEFEAYCDDILEYAKDQYINYCEQYEDADVSIFDNVTGNVFRNGIWKK